ncbi:PQQ-binding-like beta-propeller repeat protein [Cohnella lubricantis]|uniref:PQQ-binding-like beta-propeller repeat protein n=1 Tax=Cohnella lubricantis TaxID=2163172 RepID=A0A841T4H2_9BACL|nr:PQQ-binding-like beta-propeller repeat protein [Cohnella lubricantis]MBB6675722.1 PQQ-binding-like beta-propeller repeat protein [Cohnella lubricantis]MBP2118866.1 ABC-type sugar transport system permease subunit/outer membrane protein assembly factor BamB [Cohnella lubricantis]
MRRTPQILLALALLIGLVPQYAAAQGEWSIEGADDITSISAMGDGSRIAIGSHGSKAVVYDKEGTPLYEKEANNVINAVDLLDDGTLLVASDDRHLYAYDSEGTPLWDADMKRQVKSVSASEDGSVIVAVVQRVNDLLFMNGQTGEQIGAAAIGATMKTAQVSDNGQWVLAATADQYLHLLDGTGKPLLKIGASGQIQSIDITGDGDIAAGTSDGRVELFTSDGEPAGNIGIQSSVSAVAFSKDGASLGVADLTGNFYIFDSSGKQLWEMKVGEAGRSVEFSPDSKTMYAGTDDGRILQLDVSSVVAEAKSQARMRIIAWTIGAAAAIVLVLLLLRWMQRRGKLGIFREIWRSKWIYLGLAPSFILIFTFLYFPAFSGLFHSLYQWQPGGRTTYIGLDNFERMIHDPYVTKGLVNLLILIVTGLIKSLIPPLIVAELIYHLRSKKLQYGFRTAFTASMIIPSVAGLLIWQNFYDPNMGLFNNFLHLIGLGSWAHGWLGDPDTALWALIFIGFPFVGILQLLVFYAGLLSISNELIESARMDGASLPRIIRSIHLPLLSGQFKFLIILGLIGIIQDFNSILIVTAGGPMDSTYVPALQMYYAATKFNDLGYASALGVSMFAVILVITVINMKFIKSAEE